MTAPEASGRSHPVASAATGPHVLAVDLGSSGMRSLLVPVDRPWAPREGASARYRTYHPRAADALAARFVEAGLHGRLIATIAGGVAGSGVRPQDVIAISITAQRGGTAFLDAAGAAVYVGPNTDLRAVFEGAAMDEAHAAEIYARTGHLPSLFFPAAKIAWWRAHHPRLASRIRRVATLGAWATARLTGEWGETRGALGEAALLDISSGEPPAALLAALGVSPNLLSPLVEEGAPVGGLRADMAAATGLRAGTPVHLAGPDAQAALLGMGAVAPGDAGIVAGWSAPTQLVTERPTFDAGRRTWTGLHLVPGHWVVEANAGDTGGTLDMVRRIIGPRADLPRLDALIAKSRQGANLLTAFLGPHALDLANPGMTMGGLLAPAPITYNALHAGHLARATVENIVYAMADCVARVSAVAGRAEPRSIAFGGGMAASPLITQVLADVLRRPVRRGHARASAIGAGIVAARPRAGWAAAGRDVAARLPTVEPDARAVVEYREFYARWQRLRERLAALSDEL